MLVSLGAIIHGLSFLQLNLTAGEEFEIEYEVDGWFYVSVQKIDNFYEKEPYLCCLSKPIVYIYIYSWLNQVSDCFFYEPACQVCT